MKSKVSLEAFNSMPVSKAVMSNALPAMITMLMFLTYNLADILFLGMAGDPYQVAAISLCTPLFMLFTAMANIFGMGGISVIARAAGEGRRDDIKKVSSFCTWTGLAVGVAITAVYLLAATPILNALGASNDTSALAQSYLRIIALSGPFALLSGIFSKLLTADGQPQKAMMGSTLGNLLNLVLDPLFILVLNWGIVGAGVATLVGNVVAAGYFAVYFARYKGQTSLSISVRDYSAGNGIWSSVLAIGIPAALGSLIMGVSNMFVNKLMAGYGDMALAGVGVASKITMITGMICMGIGQGVQPLLGYSIGAKDSARYHETLRFSLIFATVLGAILTATCYLFTDQIVGAFLTDAAAYAYAFEFGRIFLTTSFLFGIFYVLLNSLQAMGAALPALIVNISRQGLIFVPTMYALNGLMGASGIAWAQPVADVLSIVLVTALSIATSVRKLKDPTTQAVAA